MKYIFFNILLITLLSHNVLGQSGNSVITKKIELVNRQTTFFAGNSPSYLWDGEPLNFSGNFEINFKVTASPKSMISIALACANQDVTVPYLRELNLLLGIPRFRGDIYLNALKLEATVHSASDFSLPFFDNSNHTLTLRFTKENIFDHFFDVLVDNMLQRRFQIHIEDEQLAENTAILKNGTFEVIANDGTVNITEVTYKKIEPTKYFINFIAFGCPSCFETQFPKGSTFIQWLKIDQSGITRQAYGYFPKNGKNNFRRIEEEVQNEYLPVPWENPVEQTYRVRVSKEDYERSILELKKWMSSPNRMQFNRLNAVDYISTIQKSAKESIHGPFTEANGYSFDAIAWINSYQNGEEPTPEGILEVDDPSAKEPTVDAVEPSEKFLAGGGWTGSENIKYKGGQLMHFKVTNTNILGTTITISSNHAGRQSLIIPPLSTVDINFTLFGDEPIDWTFDISTDSDVFVVTWKLYSTWVPGR